MKDCLVKPCVENNKGEVVDSRLFQGLLSLFPGNRAEAWRHYDIATDTSFLEAYGDKISLDENGEVELQSYIEAIGMHEKNFPMEEALNKELHKGSYSYQEAIEKVSAFNRKQPKDSKYIATIRPTEKKGVYKIFVAQNTDVEKAAIKKVIKNQNIQDRIIGHLAEHGVSVSFTDGDSRYSTENAERNANGLWQLIEFSKTGKVSHYAEEAGHFIMGAMGDSPLAVRLETLLSDKKTRDAILDEEHITQDLGSNPAREAAGIIIGQALQDRLSNNILKRLTSRLLTSAKKIFSKLSRNTVLQAVVEAEEIAQSFVEDFVTDNISEGEKKAREKVETLYHREEKEYVTAVKEIFDALEKMRKGFKNVKPIHFSKNNKSLGINPNVSIADLIGEIIKTAGDIVIHTDNKLSYPQMIACICMRLDYILQEVIGPNYANLKLNDADIDANSPITATLPPLEAATVMQEEAARCLTLSKFAKNLHEIGTLIDNLISLSNTKVDNIADSATHYGATREKFKVLLSTLRNHQHLTKLSQAASEAYKSKTANIAASFLQHIYGSRFIEYNKGMLWNLSRGNTTVYKFGELEGEAQHENAIDVTQIVEEDDPFVLAGLKTLSNSKDIGAQLIVKAIKTAQDTARQSMGKAYSELIALKRKGEKAGIKDTSKFYTRNEKGELTGNLIYLHEENGETFEIDWYNYKKDRTKLINEAYQAFATEIRDGKLLTEIYANSPDAVRNMVFEEFLKNSTHSAVKAFRDFDSNSKQTILGTDKYIPKDPKYRKKTTLNADEIYFLKEHKKLMDKYKSWLGQDNTMEDELAPQVRGSHWNTIGNLAEYSVGASLKAIGKSLWNAISSIFTSDTELVNTAAHYNWNTEDLAEHENKVVRGFLNKTDNIISTPSKMLPVYHHRRLKDTHRLDTDLIAATIQFAAMAANYNAMSSIINPLEITREQLNSRRPLKPNTIKDIRRLVGSKVLDEYINSQVYGINYGMIDEFLRGSNKFLTHTAQFMGRIMTLWYLGANAFSAGINAIVGYIEIFRHACNKQDFTITDLTTATLEYIGRGIPAIVESFVSADWDKMSFVDSIVGTGWAKMPLFARKFNALDDTEEYYRKYRSSTTERVVNWFSPISLLMKPYAISEHMMQIVPYMAMAKKLQLYAWVNEDSTKEPKLEKMSLWKALEVANSYHTFGDRYFKGAKELRLTHTMFKSEEDCTKFRQVQTLYNVIDKIQTERKENKDNTPFNWSTVFSNIAQGEQNPVFELLAKEELINLNKLLQYGPEKVLEMLKEKMSSLTFNSNDMATFTNKARLVTNNMHGVYNKADKTVLHRTIFGMLLLPFKGYAFGMINKRWGAAHYNVLLDREFEGYHKATAKTAAHLGKDVIDAIYNFSKGLMKDKPLREKCFDDAFEALKHLSATGLAWTTNLPFIKQIAPEWSKRQIDRAGNEAQATAFGETARTAAILATLYFFKEFALALAMGTEDDEYIDILGTLEDEEFQIALVEAKEKNNFIDIEDFRIDYILSKYPQFKVWGSHKKDTNTDKLYNKETMRIDLSTTTIENIYNKVYAKYSEASESEKWWQYKKAVTEHVKSEIKRCKKIEAEQNRPGWNMAAALSNRIYREQAAFDTWTGVTSEGKSLIDIYPLSLKAVQDIVHLISITKVGAEFQQQTLYSHDGYRMQDVEVIAHCYDLLGGKENKKIAESIRSTKTFTVEQAAVAINLPKHMWVHNLPDITKKNGNSFGTSDMTKAKNRFKIYIESMWKEKYPEKEMDKYIYTRSKKGKYNRYDPIGVTLWEYKLNPLNDLIYKSKHGEQAVRDYNFGMTNK